MTLQHLIFYSFKSFIWYGNKAINIYSVEKKYISSNQIMVRRSSVPERVTYTILEVNEIVFIDLHQVPAVEVKISFLENVAKSFPLRLFFILGVADKRSDVCDLGHQQSCLTFKKKPHKRHSFTVIYYLVRPACIITEVLISKE